VKSDNNTTRSVRFRVGLALIALNYVFVGASIALGAAAIADSEIPWLTFSGIAFALSWVVFGAGVWLAGPGAVRLIRRFVIGLFARHGNTP